MKGVPAGVYFSEMTPNIPQIDGVEAGCCLMCGGPGPTSNVRFNQNIGALVMRFSKTVEGPLCASCVTSAFWSCTLTTLFLGWWGLISLFLTPIFILGNLISYASATRRWGAVLGGLALFVGAIALLIVWLASASDARPRRRVDAAPLRWTRTA